MAIRGIPWRTPMSSARRTLVSPRIRIARGTLVPPLGYLVALLPLGANRLQKRMDRLAIVLKRLGVPLGRERLFRSLKTGGVGRPVDGPGFVVGRALQG